MSRAMKNNLTDTQKVILDYLRKTLKSRRFPPSIKEIAKNVGLSSTSSVHHQLRNLEKLGLIKRDPLKSRCIELVNEQDNEEDSGQREIKKSRASMKQMCSCPLLEKAMGY